MKHALYQIDAFASRPFEGNPAAVIPLTEWLSDSVMQSIASENNLSETAFFVPADDGYAIRWFTPVDEVDLCGHATLASAHVLFSELSHPGDRIRFSSRSGPLSVTRNGDCLTLDFPAQPPSPINPPDRLLEGLGLAPSECLAREDYLAVFRSEHEVASLAPDAGLLASLDRRGVIATAPSDRFDFVCRFFAPALGVPEDPVTGSAFTQLTPYWAQRLDRLRLRARQISARGGELGCELAGDRVLISGYALTYLTGSIQLP